MNPIRYGSVCSGVEAASLAWMPLGWEAAWFSEIEPFPCADRGMSIVYEKHAQDSRVKTCGECSPQLNAKSGTGGGNLPLVRGALAVRRLLPIETERLMGFPDNWTRIPWRGKPEEQCPDSPRYKACGNSMCVNDMRWIGMRIENVERRMK